ncbi:hypothetical protein ACF0H5_012635 [Mactra antiquata]
MASVNGTRTTVLSKNQHKNLCIHHIPNNDIEMDTTNYPSDSNKQHKETQVENPILNSSVSRNTINNDNKQGENDSMQESAIQRLDQCNNSETEKSEITDEILYDDHSEEASSTKRLSPIGCNDLNGDRVSLFDQNVENSIRKLSINNNGDVIPDHKTHANLSTDTTVCQVNSKPFIFCDQSNKNESQSSQICTESLKEQNVETENYVCTTRSESLEIDGPETINSNNAVETEIPNPVLKGSFMSDILLLYTEDDEEIAEEFKEHLLRDINVENLTVDLIGDINCGETQMSTLGKLHDSHINILPLITPNLKESRYQQYVNEAVLVLGLTDDDKKDRFIPVWITEDKTIIKALVAFKNSGIDFFRYKNNSQEYIQNRYRNKVKQMIIEGREKLLKDDNIDLNIAPVF